MDSRLRGKDGDSRLRGNDGDSRLRGMTGCQCWFSPCRVAYAYRSTRLHRPSLP